MVTLSASGLGFLTHTHTPKVWQSCDGETLTLVATLKKWRKACQERDPEVVKGNTT